MDSLHSLQQQLMQQIDAHQPLDLKQDVVVFTAQVKAELNLLAWLKAQSDYPQFYLNSRVDSLSDNQHCLAAVGKVRSFSDINSAQAFIHNHALILVGGITFNGQSDFYVPRILLQQKDHQLIASLCIDNRLNWHNEKQSAVKCLEIFAKNTALLPLRQSVKLVSQRANQQQWCEWVEQALAEIQKGTFNKAVLANESLFESEDVIDAIDLLAESESKNTGCYHFLFAEQANSVFIGSSPERLYLRDGCDLKTEALAGTASMTENAEQNQKFGEWLLNDKKNEYENRLVVDDICGNIQAFTTQIEVQPIELKRLRVVQHLRRKIFAKLTALNGDEVCLKAIHPTAAVAGLPKQAALAFLKQIEIFDRSWYAGTLGFMSQVKSEFCVTLRSAFVEQNRIRIFAGAGIVAGSIPLLEWQEIERKASGLLSLLQSSGE
ncbi:isochorismate synthase [Pasteurella bettyae]|uniref:Isochorismate synthase MenF n=1 Tax=Pasteurella bettyae CCUG 2042 TaxID=1095749 RepID=I3D6I6_9PAST|nr:isochorismate synthase [Pasteurella bettyae]EIJ67329.1 isochorismate synthase [Pasteurella bettyae CCUG 2042]SUB21161.1 menaquinone-specific isochorismate synthase [Pasteurella bettyae]